MRICLVRLPSPYLINEKAFPPLGLLSVATALKQAGHEVIVHDGEMKDIPLGYDGYGLGPSVTEYSSAVSVLRTIKSLNPKARVVVGGPHPTLNADECLKDGFDCVVLGDGEFASEKAFTDVSVNRVMAEPLPLDAYPITDRSFINIKEYKYFIDGRLATPIITAKGCPYRCGFCSKVYTGVRKRSIQHVVNEIDYLNRELGYEAVMFFDDTFILDTERVQAIALYIKMREMKWRCLVRGDLIVRAGDDFVKMLYRNNCVEVGMGIESGSNKILSNINKGETVETIKEAILMLKHNGIRVKGFFIFGLPGESEETLGETEKFITEMPLDDIDCSIFKPYAGSPIYKNKEDYDIQWDRMDYAETFYKGNGRHRGGNIRTSALSNKQIVDAMYRLEDAYKKGMYRNDGTCYNTV